MRKLVPLHMGLGLVATAALAEPAKLSEIELGGVAAGQYLGSNFSLSTLEALTTTTTTSTTNNTNDADTAMSVFESNVVAEQSLAGQSSNAVNALGMLDSSGVSATGNASAVLTGSIANSVP
ncbi:MAG TPA: hypothetical protein VFY87_27855 [Geminicoccaceae bacterium]|nr:hypothetical protein [Geminicoccaceae bacterium]